MNSELIHTILDIWLLLIAIASTWAGRYWRKRCKAAEAINELKK